LLVAVERGEVRRGVDVDVDARIVDLDADIDTPADLAALDRNEQRLARATAYDSTF